MLPQILKAPSATSARWAAGASLHPGDRFGDSLEMQVKEMVLLGNPGLRFKYNQRPF